ncbi:uncharacterized protein LOC119301950 isoform X4 [Triticum dicoccoides]|uniref:uncharacterized protein LOC119301950 isoform X4 n=1 Tax=Triticum dicoccoides TaxID=85692 RepID=UPI00188DD716|nr:uncharacterized protein LOC119301950 isoform X4 [Triticum dicoccoides]
MLQSSCQQSNKGKQKVVDDNNKSHRTGPNGMPPTQTGLFIREPTCVTHLSYSSSSDDEVTNQSAVIFPTNNGMLTSIEYLERGESSKGQKRACEALRYASRTPEQIQARRERVRARRQNLTPNEKERINAHRRKKRQHITLDERNASQRARRQSLTLDERQERNARQRARRKSLPPEERQALLAQRKASYAAKRDTLYKDSVAMQYPKGSLVGHLSSSSYVFSCPSTLAQTSATVQGNLESIPEAVEEDHIVFTNTGSPTESFVADDNQFEEEDDEYFIFAGRGDDEDCDDMMDAFTAVPDPYDRVYENIPVRRWMKPELEGQHC